ncbi:hypothetical protein [Streptomyces roseolilacinus]|uniref:hypothetical protein n=1 Tax=Streptomyces roseolilacinus TaxID=66904 RepID=UPI0037F40778
MAKAGFDHPAPLAAATDERWRTPEPTPAERATARADAACRRTSGVMTVRAAAETRVQHGLIRQNADRLRGTKVRKDRWPAAARRVLDRAWPARESTAPAPRGPRLPHRAPRPAPHPGRGAHPVTA